jgi:hypothetical protein
MPRFLHNQGRQKHAALFEKLAVVLDEKPELEGELEQFARKSTRRRRVAAAA